MTTLTEIRNLSTRLHSHVLEWDDRPLLDELLYLLDELQYLHDDLDRSNIPTMDAHQLDLTLRQRVGQLIRERKLPALRDGWDAPLDFYGYPIEVQPRQLRLF